MCDLEKKRKHDSFSSVKPKINIKRKGGGKEKSCEGYLIAAFPHNVVNGPEKKGRPAREMNINGAFGKGGEKEGPQGRVWAIDGPNRHCQGKEKRPEPPPPAARERGGKNPAIRNDRICASRPFQKREGGKPTAGAPSRGSVPHAPYG